MILRQLLRSLKLPAFVLLTASVTHPLFAVCFVLCAFVFLLPRIAERGLARARATPGFLARSAAAAEAYWPPAPPQALLRELPDEGTPAEWVSRPDLPRLARLLATYCKCSEEATTKRVAPLLAEWDLRHLPKRMPGPAALLASGSASHAEALARGIAFFPSELKGVSMKGRRKGKGDEGDGVAPPTRFICRFSRLPPPREEGGGSNTQAQQQQAAAAAAAAAAATPPRGSQASSGLPSGHPASSSLQPQHQGPAAARERELDLILGYLNEKWCARFFLRNAAPVV